MKNIVDIILKEKPSFQVKSGAKSSIKSTEQLFFRSVDGVETSNMERTEYTIDKSLMKYIQQNSTNLISLETGGGNSTLIFGQNSKKHYTINPDKTACKLIKEFLDNNNIENNISYIKQASENALPNISNIIENQSIDICLIDGNHSFPAPIIDWFYIDPLLKKNSILIIDDFKIKAVDILIKFLKEDDSYQYERRLGDALVFIKKSDVKMGWLNQKMNRNPSIVFKSYLKKVLPEFLVKALSRKY